MTIIIFILLFTFITAIRFRTGLFLLFLLLPTYLIRFNIGSLPTTLLEIMIWIILIVWILKYRGSIILNLKSSILNHKLLFIASAIFLTATTISIFTSVDIRSAAGEWKAFYVEPILVFIILVTSYKLLVTKNFINKIIYALILSGLITSTLAIYQHFTGWMVPDAFWENRNTFRVTAWYGFPNGVGLFLAPLLPLTIYLIKKSWNELKTSNWKLVISNYETKITNYQLPITNYLIIISSLLFLISAPLAIFFAKSTGGLVGVAAGIGLLLIIYKKTRWPTIIIGVLGLLSIFSIPSLSNFKQELLLQDRSGQIRLSIYKETIEFIKDNPIKGAGLASYTERIEPYHTTVNSEGIEIFHHPHNIFLTMWINLGLLGLISFILILISVFSIQYSVFRRKRELPLIRYFLLSSLVVIIVTGLVDSPYIKNDLSILFWLLPALLITTERERTDELSV